MLPAPPSWSPHFSPPSFTTSPQLSTSVAPPLSLSTETRTTKICQGGSFQVVFYGRVSGVPHVSHEILFQNIV